MSNENKTEFVTGLLRKKKFTAREIALKVIEKFPEPNLSPEEALRKAIHLVRAMPWHLKQKNIEGGYLREREALERKQRRLKVQAA